jgi:hypothetical protein
MLGESGNVNVLAWFFPGFWQLINSALRPSAEGLLRSSNRGKFRVMLECILAFKIEILERNKVGKSWAIHAVRATYPWPRAWS